jgi:hypothetical protein
MMEQGFLHRTRDSRFGVDELHLPLHLDRQPLQAFAGFPQDLVQRAEPVERALRVTGDGPDELLCRSPGDLRPASFPILDFEEEVALRIGEGRDPPERDDFGRVSLGDGLFEVKATPLRPDLNTQSRQHR